MEDPQDAIGRIEREIRNVEEAIKSAEDEAGKAIDKGDRDYWRQKEVLLRQKEVQMRQKEAQLRGMLLKQIAATFSLLVPPSSLFPYLPTPISIPCFTCNLECVLIHHTERVQFSALCPI